MWTKCTGCNGKGKKDNNKCEACGGHGRFTMINPGTIYKSKNKKKKEPFKFQKTDSSC